MSMTATAAPKGPSLADMRAAGVHRQTGRQAGGGTVAAFMEGNRGSIETVLPKHLNADRLLKVAMGAIRNNPKLMDCSVQSLLGAIIACAQLGLEPNTAQGHIFLIPFGNQVQVVLGYRGMIDLARRSGHIESISARAWHANDRISIIEGTDERIDHVPALANRGEVKGYYATAKIKGGGVQFVWLTKGEVEAVRDKESKGYKNAKQRGKGDNPWITHFDEMAAKTVIRRLYKFLPTSIEMAGAAEIDSQAGAGKPVAFHEVLDGADYSEIAQPAGDDATDDTQAGPATQVIEHQPSVDVPLDTRAGVEPAREPVKVAEPKPEPEQRRVAGPAPSPAPREPAGFAFGE